ncbi:MAG: DUF167 domain-containing protein [Polyangiales bacterium]
MDELALSERDGAVCFQVRVSPRASREGLSGVHGGALKVSLTAAPVDGAANEALVALLAKTLRVPKRAVIIAHGEHGRTKSVRVEGVALAAARALLCPEETGERAAASKGRKLPLVRASAQRLDLPTIMDRALAQKHGSAYVQLAAFAIDVDRAYVATSDDAGLPFGWEVFLTERHLLGRTDPENAAQVGLLAQCCLSILEQPPDAQGYGSQLLFAVYDAVERGLLPQALRALFSAWSRKPKQLRKALDALWQSPDESLARCAAHVLDANLDSELTPPTRQALEQMRARRWPS